MDFDRRSANMPEHGHTAVSSRGMSEVIFPVVGRSCREGAAGGGELVVQDKLAKTKGEELGGTVWDLIRCRRYLASLAGRQKRKRAETAQDWRREMEETGEGERCGLRFEKATISAGKVAMDA